jgi:hypothetical protein
VASMLHLLCCVAMGQDAGPWSDSRWFQQRMEAVDDYIAVADPSSPMSASTLSTWCSAMVWMTAWV